MERTYYVYILASQRNGTLYVGVSGDLSRRVYQHREGLTPGFTTKVPGYTPGLVRGLSHR